MESVDSLVKWDKVTYKNSQDKQRWHFLQAMNEAYCSWNVSFGCHPCTRQILLWLPGSRGPCPLEDLSKEDSGIRKGHINLQVIPILHCHNYGAAYTTIIYQSLVIFFLLLHASWFFFCQAVAILYYDKRAVKLVGYGVMVGKLRIDENKVLTGQSVGASSCARQLIPRYDPSKPPIEYLY